MAARFWNSRSRGAEALAPWLVGVLAFLSAFWNTGFGSPPRYDGAGYAVLGWSLASGSGYYEISHPDAPPHTHFPPGYPLVLGALFGVCGRSVAAAHVLSVLCTSLAAVATWAWFRRIYHPVEALLLGVAVAVNWAWGRNGGAIQSEPLFLLLAMTATLAACSASERGSSWGVLVGLALAASVLTRHVGVCLVAAVVLDMILRRRLAMAVVTAATAAAGILPWVAWLLRTRRGSQAGLFRLEDLGTTLASQSLFYLRRIPDQVFGPFVEVATIYQSRPAPGMVATVGSAVLSAIVVCGWVRTLRSRPRRLAGLSAMATLALLLVWPFTEAGRFLIPLIPFILVGAVEGLALPLYRVGLRHPRRSAAWLLLLTSIPYSAYSIATGRAGASRRNLAAFDAACAWIAHHADQPGPVLTTYPANVYWQTRRQALEPEGADPRAVNRLIEDYGVAYLLLNEKPFTNAPDDPLGRFVATEPARARRVWGRPGGVSVFAVVAPAEPTVKPGVRSRPRTARGGGGPPRGG